MTPNRNVVIIPAMKRAGNNGNKDETPKLRVAAYCRVSTDSEEQSPLVKSKIVCNFLGYPTSN